MATTSNAFYSYGSILGQSASATTTSAYWGADYASSSGSTSYWMNTSQGLTMTYPTTYAGYGAYGSQGVLIPNQYGNARLQMQRSRDPESMNIRLGARITMERSYVPIMPNTWTNWVEEAYSGYTDNTYTVEFENRVWQTWISTTPEMEADAQQHLLREAAARTDEEFQRRHAELQRAYAEQQRQYQEQQKKERERKIVAEETAQVLLGELIGEEELAVYKETGRILVMGKEFDYLLHKGGKVQRIEKHKVVDLCVYTTQKCLMPETDNIIGLALHIKADEKQFNKTANHITTRERQGELPRAANG